MMDRLACTELRRELAELLNRVQYQGLRLVVQRRGKDAAAMVPVEDLRLLEMLEDHLEEEWALEAARAALAEGGEPILANRLWKELGL